MPHSDTQPSPPKPRAVVLLSGGLDSAVALASAREAGRECHALSFDYGQRHGVELEAAARVAANLGVVRHVVADVDLRVFGGSALTSSMEVPKDRPDSTDECDIPVTYVPARNLIFLSYAAAMAEVLDADAIYIGVNAVDYSGYPDCRPEFIRSFEKTARLGTKAGSEGRDVHVKTPLIDLTKAEIIRRGTDMGVDFSLTHSCYDPDEEGRACGHCDSCRIRRAGFTDAGVADPTIYAPGAFP